MISRTKTYDPRSFDLAEHFLADEPLLKGRERDLAIVIQQTIEDWINWEKRERSRTRLWPTSNPDDLD